MRGRCALGPNQVQCCVSSRHEYFPSIPAARELYCGAKHMQRSRKKDGSWVQCTGQKSCEEPSRQCLTEERRQLIFSKALKELGKNPNCQA